MTSYNEWQLLCISEDIEPGDTLVCEHVYDKERTMKVIFCRESDCGNWIITKDRERKVFMFNQDNLDQKGKRTKQWRIVKKSDIDLSYVSREVPFGFHVSPV